jgi:hypothetical protein
MLVKLTPCIAPSRMPEKLTPDRCEWTAV